MIVILMALISLIGQLASLNAAELVGSLVRFAAFP